MHQTAVFGYLAEDGLVGVRLPYGEGDLALYAFMPDEWEGFVEGLTPERYAGWVERMGRQEIRLAFPKIRLTDRAELADPLAAMGMDSVAVATQAKAKAAAGLSGSWALQAGPRLPVKYSPTCRRSPG